MSTLITWDPRKRLRNIRQHGIDFADLDRFFDNDPWSGLHAAPMAIAPT
jgi:uncharacterized DUF497 family protein